MINTFQLKNAEEKDDKFIKMTALEIIQEAEMAFNKERQEFQQLWDVYNGTLNNNKYNYLTKADPHSGLIYPAKVRDIGAQVVRSKINILESEQARRKARFKATVSDERSQKKKYEYRMRSVLDAINAQVSDRYLAVQSVIQQVNEQLQDMEQQLQVQPENEEMAMQLETMRANMPAIRLEYQRMLRELQREDADLQDLSKRVLEFRKYNEVEICETIANAFIKGLIVDPDKRDDFNKGFREKIVTGRPTYLVNFNKRTGKVDFKQVDAMRSFYSKSSSSKWSHKGDWCATLEYMSVTQVAAEFQLTSGEIKNLDATFSGKSLSPMISYNSNSAVFDENGSKERNHGGVPVWRVWWLSPREWWWLRKPNKHREGEFFNHAVTDIRKLKGKDKDFAERYVVYDRYSAVVIGDDIIKNTGVDMEVFRPSDMPGMPMLPLVCRSFSNPNDNPYSLIKRTDQLRELYDILWYMLELNIVLSGVKGLIMDKSQKPDKMSTKEWLYYRKTGTAWIETMKKGRRVPATFNQFQTYDDTLSQSVSIIFEILSGIEGMIGKVLGVTDPRMGETVAKDPVHNVMMSQEQSSLITEIQFYDADLVYAEAVSLYLNLAFKYELKQGKVINHLDEDKQEVLYKIPSGVMDKSDFTIKAWNNIQEDHIMDMLRQQAGSSGINAAGMAALFRIDSLAEMENRLAQIITEQSEAATQNAMAVDNNKAEADQRTLQLKAELEQYQTQMKAQVEQAKMELEKMKLNTEMQYKQWEMGFKERELETKANLSMMEIASENEVENAYLKETQRSNMTQELLEQYRMRIESILNAESIKQQGEVKKEEVKIKKAQIDATRRKNNIKD